MTQCPVQLRYCIINGDTRRADTSFADEQFDTLITDFPYGVRTGTRTEKLVPIQLDKLLNAALPSWKRLLKPCGAIVLAYNRHTLTREILLSLMEKHGLRQRFPQFDLSERISQKIHRDIIAFERVDSSSHIELRISS